MSVRPSLKIRLGHTTRLLTYPMTANPYTELVEEVYERFSLAPSKHFEFIYLDAEGDAISISSDVELIEVLNLNLSASLKLSIQFLPPSSSPSEIEEGEEYEFTTRANSAVSLFSASEFESVGPSEEGSDNDDYDEDETEEYQDVNELVEKVEEEVKEHEGEEDEKESMPPSSEEQEPSLAEALDDAFHEFSSTIVEASRLLAISVRDNITGTDELAATIEQLMSAIVRLVSSSITVDAEAVRLEVEQQIWSRLREAAARFGNQDESGDEVSDSRAESSRSNAQQEDDAHKEFDEFVVKMREGMRAHAIVVGGVMEKLRFGVAHELEKARVSYLETQEVVKRSFDASAVVAATELGKARVSFLGTQAAVQRGVHNLFKIEC